MYRIFGKQFDTFTPKAWATYKGENHSDWARAKAREFWHTVNNKIAFAFVYDCLMRFINIMTNEKATSRLHLMVANLDEDEDEDEGEEYEGEESEEDEENVPRSALERDTRLVNAITPTGRQTSAEERYARNELNRTLFREFKYWYDAFEAEAAEDTTKGAPNAKQRFSRHCANILGRRTGLRKDLLEGVVTAWLKEHLSY